MVVEEQGRPGAPPPLLQRKELFKLPADRILDVVEALLYVHRRTHEHDYEAADWSKDLPPTES